MAERMLILRGLPPPAHLFLLSLLSWAWDGLACRPSGPTARLRGSLKCCHVPLSSFGGQLAPSLRKGCYRIVAFVPPPPSQTASLHVFVTDFSRLEGLLSGWGLANRAPGGFFCGLTALSWGGNERGVSDPCQSSFLTPCSPRTSWPL